MVTEIMVIPSPLGVGDTAYPLRLQLVGIFYPVTMDRGSQGRA
jgi:hypothetical protein